MSERKEEKERERVCVFVCVWHLERAELRFASERNGERERDRECVCVCVLVGVVP